MKTGYLSFSGNKWRVIYQGLPLCADKATRTEAEQIAAQMKVKLSAEFWDGDKGDYFPLPIVLKFPPSHKLMQG
jgi:hypothetical protein